MIDVEKRRLTISDTMIIVAVIAISMVWLRFMYSFQESGPFPFQEVGVKVNMGSIWVVLIFMLALIPLRLRHPRPPIAHLWRQPGWLACNAVGLTFTINLFWAIPSIIPVVSRQSGPLLDQAINWLIVSMTFETGRGSVIAVAAAWATLALAVGWESEKGWIDRTGRLRNLRPDLSKPDIHSIYCQVFAITF